MGGMLGTLFGGASTPATSGGSSATSSIGNDAAKDAAKDSTMKDVKQGYDTYSKYKSQSGHDTYTPGSMAPQQIGADQNQISAQPQQFGELMNYLQRKA